MACRTATLLEAYPVETRNTDEQLSKDLRVAYRDGFRVYRVPGFSGCEQLGCQGPLADTPLGRLLQSGLVLTGADGFDVSEVVELTAPEQSS